jgi:hypothetical protein
LWKTYKNRAENKQGMHTKYSTMFCLAYHHVPYFTTVHTVQRKYAFSPFNPNPNYFKAWPNSRLRDIKKNQHYSTPAQHGGGRRVLFLQPRKFTIWKRELHWQYYQKHIRNVVYMENPWITRVCWDILRGVLDMFNTYFAWNCCITIRVSL